MRGHVRKRGKTWAYWVDGGRHPAQRCTGCAKRYWVERSKPLFSCPACGGELADTQERRQLTRAGFKRRSHAEDALNDAIGAAGKGGSVYSSKTTLRDWCSLWLADQEIRARTRERYEGLLRAHLLPELGGMKLGDIRPANVKAAMTKMGAKGLSPASIGQARAVLSSALQAAVLDGILQYNAARAVKPPKKEGRRAKAPDDAQLQALLEASRGSAWEIPVLLAVATGARRSEVLGLSWAGIDLDRGTLSITRTLQRIPGPDGRRLGFLPPKTERSKRTVALPAFAIERLRRHRVEQTQRRLKLGTAWRGDLDLVVDNGTGGPVDPDSFGHAFKRVAKQAGWPESLRLHDVRHGVATSLFRSGVHPLVASAVLGHSSPSFTMAVYGHTDHAMTATAAAAIEEALGGGR